jgi:8-oxo-dGTP pyrophosphatase MutT (NUDIX family)
MLAPKLLLREFVAQSCQFDPAESMLPFTIEGVLTGWLRRDFAQYLNEWPEHFAVRSHGVGMLSHFASAEHRSAAMTEVLESLASRNVIAGWRGEAVTVAESFHATPLLHVERAASRYFGFTMYAAHLNGLTARDGQACMWIATRADSKAIDPGKFDNVTAGRIPRGLSARETLTKEALEEAGIGAAQIINAKSGGAVRCKYAVGEGLHHEVMFVYDIVLPEDFAPKNQDGEVAEFTCHPISHVLELLQTPGIFTVDAALVIIDCLIRRGYLTPDREDYLDIIHAMRP